MRRLALAAGLVLAPAFAAAEGTMPQMDFHNPLTFDQLIWLVVILVVLYLVLASWGLPRIGAVLATRDAIIARDLDAARTAKTAADREVATMNASMKTARSHAHTEIANAVAAAKAQAEATAAAATQRLDAELERAEAQIATARRAGLAAIKPVAEQTAQAILQRLTGNVTDEGRIAAGVDAALAGQPFAAQPAA